MIIKNYRPVRLKCLGNTTPQNNSIPRNSQTHSLVHLNARIQLISEIMSCVRGASSVIL